jgi:hypothetical protein
MLDFSATIEKSKIETWVTRHPYYFSSGTKVMTLFTEIGQDMPSGI